MTTNDSHAWRRRGRFTGAALVLLLLAVLAAMPRAAGFVYKQPPASQDGITTPITFQFALDGGEPLYFAFESNVTVNYTVTVTTTGGLPAVTTGTAMTEEFTIIQDTAYTFNITMLAADPGVAGVDMHVRYTYTSTLGRILSMVMIPATIAIAAGFLILLLAKGNLRLAGKDHVEVHAGG